MRALKCKKFPQSSFFAVTNGSRLKIKSRRVETAPINSRVVNYRERRARRNVCSFIPCVIECKRGPKVRAVTWAAFKTFRDPYPAWKNLKKAGYPCLRESAPSRRSSRSFARSVIHPHPLHKDFVKCALYSPPIIVIIILYRNGETPERTAVPGILSRQTRNQFRDSYLLIFRPVRRFRKSGHLFSNDSRDLGFPRINFDE